MKKKILSISAILLLWMIISGWVYLYPMVKFFYQVEIINIEKDLTIVKGGGGNSGILVTDKGVVVIDTKMGPEAEELHKIAVEKAGNKPIIVINTHYHGDHVSGNHFYSGNKIYIGNYDPSFLKSNVKPENMPSDFVKDSLVMNMGNEIVVMYDLGRAHTWHDLVVYLKNDKILFTGDLVFDHVNPVLKEESGANVELWIGVLKKMISKFEIRTLVPGHGAQGGKELAIAIENYFEDMKMAAANPSKEKMMIEKYKTWMDLPGMASPAMTITYIKENSK